MNVKTLLYMKTITVPDIPENKYNLVIEFLKALKLKVIQDDKTPYQISDDEKKFIDKRLEQYLNNPKDVIDIDQFIKQVEKGL